MKQAQRKIAYIMRGIPGSGKSTMAEYLVQGFENSRLSWRIHSTDALSYVDGRYDFDPSLLSQRHKQNLVNFRNSVANGVPCVICDNTNVMKREFRPYVVAAQVFGYRIVFVELPHIPARLAARRTEHGVPVEVIESMIKRWEPSQ